MLTNNKMLLLNGYDPKCALSLVLDWLSNRTTYTNRNVQLNCKIIWDALLD